MRIEITDSEIKMQGTGKEIIDRLTTAFAHVIVSMKKDDVSEVQVAAELLAITVAKTMKVRHAEKTEIKTDVSAIENMIRSFKERKEDADGTMAGG